MPGDRVRIKRRGHDEQAQVGPQGAPHLQRERKGEVAGKRALVELVEDDEADVRQLGIGEDALREQALRHDLQPRLRGHLALQPHLIADRLANGLAAPTCDVRRAVPRGQAARLEHDDLLAREPRLVQQGGRHARRLAASRRRRQDDVAVRPQRGGDLAQLRLDRKHGG